MLLNLSLQLHQDNTVSPNARDGIFIFSRSGLLLKKYRNLKGHSMTSLPNNPSNMWVVSQSIEQCARQLMGLHEEMRVFAFGNQNRTTVKLKTIDNMHLQFELRRIRKTSLIDTLAAFVIKGDLIYQSPSATQVSYRIQPNWVMLGFVAMIMLFLCTLFAVISDLGFALFLGAFMGFGVSINVFIIAWQANHLKKQLHSTLMHPDTQYNMPNY